MRVLAKFPPSPASVVSIAARVGILKLRLATIAGIALVVLAGAGRASATNTGKITVCPSGCDYATIQDAINAAPRRAIVIIAAGTYAGFSLPGTNSALTNVTLLGAGAANTTITGAAGTGAPDGNPIVANSGVAVRIRGVTIAGNDTDPVEGGSAILNNGTLTLTNSTVSGNASMFGTTGGISNAGTLTVKDSTVSGNLSSGEACGGISNSGTLTLKDSTVSNNDSNRGSGGGICNGPGSTATVTVKDSTVSGNSSRFGGGGIANAGTLTLRGSTVSGNHGGGGGGGIYNDGTLAVKNSKLSNNYAGWGGAIYNEGTLAVKRSELSGNSAGEGGGIYNSGPLAVKNSELSDNSANEGGGIYDANGEMTLTNSIISGNTPDNCYPPGSVAGCSG